MMSSVRWYQKRKYIKVGLLKIEEKYYSGAKRSAGIRVGDRRQVSLLRLPAMEIALLWQWRAYKIS